MKKIISLFVIAFAFSSCQNEIKVNNPGFQVYKNNALWRADNATAYLHTDGSITITGTSDNQNLIVSVSSKSIGKYYLGTTNSLDKVTFNSTTNGSITSYNTDPVHGVVSTISDVLSPGTGYTADCTMSNGVYNCLASHSTTGGSGVGLKVAIATDTNGAVSYIKVVSTGDNNYFPGDVITISGGTTPATFTIVNVRSSNGIVEITGNSNGTITGSFKCNALNADTTLTNPDILSLTYGAFYQLPLVVVP